MTATLQSSSYPTRQPAALGRTPFSLAPTSHSPRHDLALPAWLFSTPSSFTELELPTAVLLAIPELGSFDQDELNDNPVFNELCAMPLIGALLLDRRLITREQLDACLLLQAQTHPDLPIGQILVRGGH